MSSDKEQFMELGEESEDLGAIHEEVGAPEAIRRIQSSQTEQRITRKPGDSVTESAKEKQFSQSRLDQLFERWDNGAEAFWTSYQERCEIVYEIQKETAKPGCKGKFSNALRRIRLSDSTAYDMIKRHRIRIGEIPDPDLPNPRDEVEENSRTAAGAVPEEGDDLPETSRKPAARVVLVLKDKSGPSQRKKAKPQSKPLRLDAREQASMVKAQLAINNVVAALKNNGDWQSALAEYDKVAVAPGKLDSFVNRLNPDPDWKQVLVELIQVLEQSGDRLPLPVLNKKRVIETMLGGGADKNPASATESAPNANAYQVEKRGEGKESVFAAVHTTRKKVKEIFQSETEAESVAESLNSPVAALSDLDEHPEKPILSVTSIVPAQDCKISSQGSCESGPMKSPHSQYLTTSDGSRTRNTFGQGRSQKERMPRYAEVRGR